MKLGSIFIAALLTASASAETLNEWLLDQVRTDEQLLSNSLSQVGGNSLVLLKEARTYVPFFLDVPQDTKFTSEDQKRSFEDWAKDSRSGFLPGGFIYRLSFHAAPPLYATSAGEWSGTVWRSLALGRDITLDPVEAWDGANGDYLYATLLAGVRPRLLVYDQQGEIKHQELLDASAVDFEQRRDAALKPYLRSHEPVLEMISLVEYLKDRDASWRTVDTSGQFNLRNQQQRPDEQKRLMRTEPLTRAAAIHLLQSLQQSTPAPAPPATPGPNATSQTEKPAAPPELATSVGQVTAATFERRKLLWPGIVGIATLIVVALLVWKRRIR